MQSITMNSQGSMRAKSAAAFLGIGESTFWRWVSEGKLPKGIHLSTRATIWRKEWLDTFLEQAANRVQEG
jgi:predicted DNA-binding transcriptional regulator AlpA